MTVRIPPPSSALRHPRVTVSAGQGVYRTAEAVASGGSPVEAVPAWRPPGRPGGPPDQPPVGAAAPWGPRVRPGGTTNQPRMAPVESLLTRVRATTCPRRMVTGLSGAKPEPVIGIRAPVAPHWAERCSTAGSPHGDRKVV